MEPVSKQFNITEFIVKHNSLLKKAEVVSIVLFFTGFILYLLKLPNSNFVFVTGCMLTAIVYFLNIFIPLEFEGIEEWESFNLVGTIAFTNFIYKLYFISLSVSIISLLELVINFPNRNPLLFNGGVILVIVLILSLFARIKSKFKVYNGIFYFRLLICLALVFYCAIEKGIF